MRFEDYQVKAEETAVYPSEEALHYLVTGLAGEVGELASVYAKSVRKDAPLDRAHLLSEVGDCLWFLSQIATELGEPLSTVARRNLAKLQGRAERGTLQGSGEDR